MWPLWVIGLIAGIAGLCVAIGVFALTSIHQHRKIKHLKELLSNYTGTLDEDIRHKSSVTDEEQPDAVRDGRSSLQHDYRMPISDNSENEMATDYQDQTAVLRPQQETERPIVAQRGTFTRPLRRLSHGGNRKRNKLKRGIPLKSISLSPLSAITEKSSSPGGSPGLVRSGAPNGGRTECLGDKAGPIPWPLDISKTRRDGATNIEDNSHVKLDKPLSDTLASLKKISTSDGKYDTMQPKDQDPTKIGVADTLSVEDTEMWEDFDFGLRPCSVRYISSSGGISTASTSSDTIPMHENHRSGLSVNWSNHLAQRRARSSMTGPPGRHSMYVTGNSHRNSSSAMGLRSPGSPDSGSPLRPTSISRVIDDGVSDQPLRSSVASSRRISQSRTRQHRRQNCVRISGIPISSEFNDQHKRYSGRTDHSQLSHLPRISFTRLENDNTPPWPRPLVLRRPRPLSSAKRRDSDVFNDTTPGTPLSTSYIAEEDESMPLQQMSSPGPSYDSPILPSPAYTSAGLFPRRPHLHGPRSFHSSYSSPTTRNHSKRHRLSTDLRRSIMMLRSMNSDETLLSKGQSRAYHNLGGECSSSNSQRNSLNSHDHATSLSQSSSRPSTPNTNIAVSHSAISIWEDASVRGDSPEPEMPDLPDLHHLIESQQPDSCTPVKKFPRSEDKENHRNIFLFEVDKNGASAKAIQSPMRSSAEDEPRVWGTPGSLYDEFGFLKE